MKWAKRRIRQLRCHEANLEKGGLIQAKIKLVYVVWSSSPLATWCKELTHWKRPWCWERLRAGEEGGRGWDGWMASPTQWTRVWASSGRRCRTGKPGVLQPLGSQRLRHDSATKRQRQRRGDRQWAVRLIFLRTLDGRGSRQLGEASVTAPGAGGATKAQRSRHCGPSPRAPPSCSPASPNSSLASVSPSADAQQRRRGLKSLCPLVKMAGTSQISISISCLEWEALYEKRPRSYVPPVTQLQCRQNRAGGPLLCLELRCFPHISPQHRPPSSSARMGGFWGTQHKYWVKSGVE